MLAIASRATHRPAITSGTNSIRPSGPRTARGTTRVAIEMSMVPSPHHSAMTRLRANQGTARTIHSSSGPRNSVIHGMCTR
jgi:hypothetical protein